ncbi:MAG TPA: hypothetical protein VLA75_10305 [Thermoanaerobaculia bacterium]|nr:hypothetical protein [Thermoanaerobaculia bacterium]
MRRFALLWLAPTCLLLALAVWPLASGERTLVLRDVLNTHLTLKQFGAEALRQGEIPLVDPTRGGGQPYLGNPNAFPLYPTDLLFLVTSTLRGLNAHLWLHWLLAPWALFWLGRRLGLAREPAWVAGILYACSGFFASLLNLANVVAGAALAPALAAAVLGASEPARRRAPAAVALLWALLILAGDPMTSALALLLALSAAALLHGRRAGWGRLAAGLALGTLAAAPQWVEMTRILPVSFRGFWGYAEGGAGGGWDLRLAPDLLWPFAFGRPDQLLFWGERLSGGDTPLLFTLFPGLLALVLLGAAAGARGRRDAWAAGLAALGLLLVVGASSRWLGWVFQLPGGDLLRFPAKAWLLTAIGASLLGGIGAERWLAGRGRRAAGWTLAGAGVLYLAAWISLLPLRGAGWHLLRAVAPERIPDGWLDGERLRLAGASLWGILIALALAGLLFAARRRPAGALAAALALHAATQLVLLAPARASDEAARYAIAPAVAAELPPGTTVAHGFATSLLMPPDLAAAGAERSAAGLQRFLHAALSPWAGQPAGLRYELNPSPEGLDQFMTQVVAGGLRRLGPRQQLQVLRATGVETLLLDREWPGLELVAAAPLGGSRLRAYRVPDPLPEAAVLGSRRPAPSLNEALAVVVDPGFDPRTVAVVAGEEPLRDGPPGSARVIRFESEEIVIEADAPAGGGTLVLRRAYLPVYRAEVDGRPARTRVANLTRLAVELPPGHHTVRVWADRRPTRIAFAAAGLALALVALLGIAGWPARIPAPDPPT